MEIEEGEKSSITSEKDGTVLDGNLAGKSSALRKAGINFWIDALAFLTFSITTVSGMALMRIRPDGYDTQTGLLALALGCFNAQQMVVFKPKSRH
jgi:hypothetical protein